MTVKPLQDLTEIFAECSTASNTAIKSITLPSYITIEVGNKLSVKFAHENRYTSGAISISINSNPAKTIYANGQVTSSSNTLSWYDNAICDFVYDGTYWHYLGNNVDTNVIDVHLPYANGHYF